MDWELIGKLFLILLLVVGNAFFVGSEIALTSARRSRIKQLAGTGNKSAKIVQVLHDEPERFYSVTQIGITLVSLALGPTRRYCKSSQEKFVFIRVIRDPFSLVIANLEGIIQSPSMWGIASLRPQLHIGSFAA